MGEAKVLVNCHVFDGRGTDVHRDQHVLVRDGKIAGIGPAALGGRGRGRSGCRPSWVVPDGRPV